LYVIAGTHTLIEQVVSLFRPLEYTIELLLPLPGYASRINFAVLVLPLGIGLLLRKELARRLAVALCWLCLIPIPIVLTVLVLALAFGDVTWHAPERPPGGAEIAHGISALLVGLPVFLWQMRELRSRDVRSLLAAGGGPPAAADLILERGSSSARG
jgi:hypothetical protein